MPESEDLSAHLATVTEALRVQREDHQSLELFIDALGPLLGSSGEPFGETVLMERLSGALAATCEALKGAAGSILLADDESAELVFVCVHPGDSEPLAWQRLSAGTGVAGWVAQNRHPIIVNNAYNDDRFFRNVDEALGFRTRSIVAAPMQIDDRFLGVLEVLNKRDDALFQIRDQTMVTLAAQLLASTLDHFNDSASVENTLSGLSAPATPVQSDGAT